MFGMLWNTFSYLPYRPPSMHSFYAPLPLGRGLEYVIEPVIDHNEFIPQHQHIFSNNSALFQFRNQSMKCYLELE